MKPPLCAHPDRPREGGPDRLIVDVAVGILVRPDGRFLMTSRPIGKVYDGYWEFPGGKLEAGETVGEALGRELQEELGIQLQSSELWHVEVVDYPHALVRLSFCKVFAWCGALQMREAQSYSWQQLPVTVSPILPGAIPILKLFASDRGFTGATH